MHPLDNFSKWKKFYPDAGEQILKNLYPEKGPRVRMNVYVDDDYVYDLVTKYP
jgi:hypothetical protein